MLSFDLSVLSSLPVLLFASWWANEPHGSANKFPLVWFHNSTIPKYHRALRHLANHIFRSLIQIRFILELEIQISPIRLRYVLVVDELA
jgi:hypothetical protein